MSKKKGMKKNKRLSDLSEYVEWKFKTYGTEFVNE